MFPCAVTFTNTTLVQDALIVSFPGGSAVLLTVQGMTAKEGWTMITRSIATIDIITQKLNKDRLTRSSEQKEAEFKNSDIIT